MFYDIYAELCAKKGVSPSRAAVDMGFYRSSVSYWKNKGGSPGKDGITKMAAYFGVPAALLTETGEKKALKPAKPVKAKEVSAAKPANREEPAVSSGTDQGDVPDNSPSMFSRQLAKAFELVSDIPSRPMTFSEKIKALRKQQGLTVDYIAKAVNVDKKTLLMWESGNSDGIRRYKLGKLAKVLNTTVDDLISSDDLTPKDRDQAVLDFGPYIELLRARGECLALFMLARKASREDIELTISFMRALMSADQTCVD
ncbi:MAG: helix-turn-helix transcriptional regulator [Clostridiales bacterium]|nr:helix-turn-helix transcriptional regulator [Clostridiales bacterium]